MAIHGVKSNMVRLGGIEPPHTAPEAVALSTELQAYVMSDGGYYSINDGLYQILFALAPKKFLWLIVK